MGRGRASALKNYALTYKCQMEHPRRHRVRGIHSNKQGRPFFTGIHVSTHRALETTNQTGHKPGYKSKWTTLLINPKRYWWLAESSLLYSLWDVGKVLKRRHKHICWMDNLTGRKSFPFILDSTALWSAVVCSRLCGPILNPRLAPSGYLYSGPSGSSGYSKLQCK